jgi:hypothetical protein
MQVRRVTPVIESGEKRRVTPPFPVAGPYPSGHDLCVLLQPGTLFRRFEPDGMPRRQIHCRSRTSPGCHSGEWPFLGYSLEARQLLVLIDLRMQDIATVVIDNGEQDCLSFLSGMLRIGEILIFLHLRHRI